MIDEAEELLLPPTHCRQSGGPTSAQVMCTLAQSTAPYCEHSKPVQVLGELDDAEECGESDELELCDEWEFEFEEADECEPLVVLLLLEFPEDPPDELPGVELPPG
jgi:hypothetical protein